MQLLSLNQAKKLMIYADIEQARLSLKFNLTVPNDLITLDAF
jgi:hypothetical protein